MTALGEMAAWIPHSSGFAGYATRFCDPALGFALGWTYWCKYIITTPNQITATALIIQEWKTAEQVNPGVWVALFLVVICCINYFGIKFFGELEFWLSTVKVITIVRLSSVTWCVTSTDATSRLVSSSYPSCSRSAPALVRQLASSTTRLPELSNLTLRRETRVNSLGSGRLWSMPSSRSSVPS
jgi:amino acid permease